MTAAHTPPRFTLIDLAPRVDTLREEVLAGLTATPKTLPCKLFYDRRGSRLFDRICGLPEYYPTRTELSIMHRHARDMADAIGPRARLVELGSGSGIKTRLLLEHLHRPAAYVPIDIAREALLASARSLAERYPRLEIRPICADYTQPFTAPAPSRPMQRTTFYFPGSTIGNFHPDDAAAFLARLGEQAGGGTGLLIGVDLRKPPAILLAAYDDADGVTAAFNANVLVRLNRELAADFRLSRFAHRVVWDDARSRIEMHLDVLEDHHAHLAGHRIAFAAGETIHTENSYKWTVDAFAALAATAGWTLRHTWTDPRDWFAVLYLES